MELLRLNRSQSVIVNDRIMPRWNKRVTRAFPYPLIPFEVFAVELLQQITSRSSLGLVEGSSLSRVVMPGSMPHPTTFSVRVALRVCAHDCTVPDGFGLQTFVCALVTEGH